MNAWKRVAGIAFVFNLLTIPIFAQDTYSLRGDGLKDGVIFLDKTISKFIMQGESTLTSMTTKVLVNKVDPAGEITAGTMIVMGEPPSDSEARASDIFADYYNKKLYFEYDGKSWHSPDFQIKIDMPELQNMFEGMSVLPRTDRSYLPLVSVPIGYQWEIDAKQALFGLSNGNSKITQMFKDMTGKAKFKFDTVKSANGSLNAIIRSKFSYKGILSLPISNTETASMSIKMDGTIVETRRLDNGLCIKNETVAEVSGSYKGEYVKMALEAVSTRDIVSIF